MRGTILLTLTLEALIISHFPLQFPFFHLWLKKLFWIFHFESTFHFKWKTIFVWNWDFIICYYLWLLIKWWVLQHSKILKTKNLSINFGWLRLSWHLFDLVSLKFIFLEIMFNKSLKWRIIQFWGIIFHQDHFFSL